MNSILCLSGNEHSALTALCLGIRGRLASNPQYALGVLNYVISARWI